MLSDTLTGNGEPIPRGVGERRVYYREYCGGISRVQAVVCHVSPS